MKSVKFITLASVAAMLPAVAFAQSADTTYCKAMAAKYREFNRGADPAANVAALIAMCDSKPGEAIPGLEKQLKDDKIALPAR